MPRLLLIGAGLLVALAGTAVLSTGAHDDVRAVVLLAAGVTCTFASGCALPKRLASAYGLVAAAAVAAWVVTSPGGLSGGPLAGPLGYGNANGALCAQGAAAAMIPVLIGRRVALRAGALLLAGCLVVLSWQTASAAGLLTAALCTALALVLALTDSRRRDTATRVVVAGAGAATAVSIFATLALAVTYDATASPAAPVERLVQHTLSERRVALWSEAVDLLRESPARGVGAGRFAETSPTARGDADARWAHSAYLQYGAETGLPGLLALLGFTGWVFVLLYRSSAFGPLAAVGGLAAAAVLTQAAVDYVLHFPAVPLIAAATVGVCVCVLRSVSVVPR